MPLTEHEEEKNQNAQRPLKENLRFAADRVAFSQLLIVGVGLLLLAGYWELQIRDQEHYAAAAERNRIKSLPDVR